MLEIIEYFKPVEWYIENPYFSAMRDLECMQGLTSYRFDYCRFGFLYQKPTRIWTNRTDLEDHICICLTKTHKYSIGITSSHKVSKGAEADESRTEDRYRIPEALLRYLFALQCQKESFNSCATLHPVTHESSSTPSAVAHS